MRKFSDRDPMGIPRIPDSWWLAYVIVLTLGLLGWFWYLKTLIGG